MGENYGGGIYITNSGSIEVASVNNTITNNIADDGGGGIYVVSFSGTATVSFVNDIIFDNTGPVGAGIWNYMNTALISIAYSDIEAIFGAYVNEGGNINADPIFANLPEEDFHLTEESPCIDAGTSGDAPSIDFEDDLRPWGEGYDIGADEYVARSACTPGSPDPSNGETSVSVSANLLWSCSGGNGWDSFDVYFGTSSPPPLAESGHTSMTYNLGTLNYNTQYYWKIVAKKTGCEPITAPTWSFTTTDSDTAAVFRVTSEGDVRADGTYYGQEFYTGSADVAEWVPVSESVEPGDVLELDPENPGHYRKAREQCSDLVAGVVSTEPGVVLGTDGDVEGKPLLALLGIVPVKVTDEGGPIQLGDLLVTSSTPGYAMRWDPKSGEPCNFVGKALESLIEERGIILVLLTAH